MRIRSMYLSDFLKALLKSFRASIDDVTSTLLDDVSESFIPFALIFVILALGERDLMVLYASRIGQCISDIVIRPRVSPSADISGRTVRGGFDISIK